MIKSKKKNHQVNKECFHFEEEAFSKGYKSVAGVDEAGRGPLAGPVVAAACILPRGLIIDGIDDSKKLTPKKREELFYLLISHPEVEFATSVIDSEVIDKINILQASLQAMAEAVSLLPFDPDFLLVDGNQSPPTGIPTATIIKGDSLSKSIGAASIIAKCMRDQIMIDYHEEWPQYGFDQHKGYGTKVHLEALEKHGPCPIHRFSFAPLKKQ